MGAAKSRMNSAQCSKTDFRSEETLNTIISTHNIGKGNKHKHRQQKGGCSIKNNNGFASVVALAGCPKPQKENNKVWLCNNAMENYGTKNINNRNYSVDALTPEQQLEEIENVYQEKVRARAGETSKSYRKSNGNGKSRTTCCNCNCNCSRTKKMDYQTKQRNGLQSISTLIEECRCRACNKRRMAQLSEAEAIADAITEYCCRARKKAERAKARNKCRCCTCNGEFKNNWRPQSMETDDDDDEESTDTEPDIEIEVENYCCSAQQRRVDGRRRRKRMEEDELEEDYAEIEEAVEEEHMLEEEDIMEEEMVEEMAAEEVDILTAAQPKRQYNEEYEQYSPIRRSQPHAKFCRCCDCKKQHSSKDESDKDELDISIEDIELEVQEERKEKVAEISALTPQSRRHAQESKEQEQKPKPISRTQEGCQYLRENIGTKECEQKAFKQEKEVLLKKTSLNARPKQLDEELREKPTAKEVHARQKPKQNEHQQSETKTRRSRSEEVPGIRVKSHKQRHVYDCRFCDCEREKAEMENWIRGETSRRSLDIEIVCEKQKARRRRLEDGPQSRRKICRSREERAKADELQSRRNINRGRQERQIREEKNTTEIDVHDRVPSVERKPQKAAENDVQSRRRYERIQNQQNTRTQSRKSYQESMEGDKPTAEAAPQQRRKPQDEPNWEQTQPRGCKCCDGRRIIADQQPASEPETEVEAEADMEPENQQNCFCFSLKKSPRKSGTGRSRSCCKCKKDRSADKNKPKIDSKAEEKKSENVPKRAKVKQQSEKECQSEYRCKKSVPLTKCCECNGDKYEPAYARDSKQRYREVDRRRSMLAEELADRLQKRAQQQISLQRRLQEQMRANQTQRYSCDPPPCCFPQFPCCYEQSMGGCVQDEPPTPACCFPPPTPQMPPDCCPPPISPPPYCLPTTPPCCYEPPPCYGQECPCCCQPIPFCYAASCSYTNPGSSP